MDHTLSNTVLEWLIPVHFSSFRFQPIENFQNFAVSSKCTNYPPWLCVITHLLSMSLASSWKMLITMFIRIGPKTNQFSLWQWLNNPLDPLQVCAPPHCCIGFAFPNTHRPRSSLSKRGNGKEALGNKLLWRLHLVVHKQQCTLRTENRGGIYGERVHRNTEGLREYWHHSLDLPSNLFFS